MKNPKKALGHWKSGGLKKYLPYAKGDQKLLNIGCGTGEDKKFLEDQGYCTYGLDVYPGDYTDVIGDGHKLPFLNHTFDVVTAIAVLEHLHTPSQAVAEINRVLKADGYFIGSVAFLEPFHGDSYYHFTHLGLCHLLESQGFIVEDLSVGWDVVQSIGSKLMYRTKILKPFYKFIYETIYCLRKSKISILKKNKSVVLPGLKRSLTAYEVDRLSFAGSIAFTSKKEKNILI